MSHIIMNSRFSSISGSIIIFLIIVVLSILVGGPLVLVANNYSQDVKDIAGALGYILPMIITVAIVVSKIDIKEGDNKSKLSNIFSFKVGNLNKYLYILIVVFAMMMIIDFTVSFIPVPDWVNELFKNAFNLSIPNIITIAVFAPLAEEIIVRGIVLQGYLTKYTPNKSIIASAIFFGAIHLNPWQFIAGFTSGLLLGWLYYKTKSLAPSIFVHFVNNSLSVLFMYYFTEPDTTFKVLFGSSYYIILPSVLIFGFIALKHLDKLINNEYNYNESLLGEKS